MSMFLFSYFSVACHWSKRISFQKIQSVTGPIQWVLDAFNRGVKQPGSEAGHARPSSARVKNGEAIPPLPHMYS
jgi:hypothetical protein